MVSGVWGVYKGVKKIKNMNDLEHELTKIADSLHAQCELIESLECSFCGYRCRVF